jgi:hypothetical protein
MIGPFGKPEPCSHRMLLVSVHLPRQETQRRTCPIGRGAVYQRHGWEAAAVVSAHCTTEALNDDLSYCSAEASGLRPSSCGSVEHSGVERLPGGGTRNASLGDSFNLVAADHIGPLS